MLLYYVFICLSFFFFFSSRRRHTRSLCDWSSDVCSSNVARQYSGTLGKVGNCQVGVSVQMVTDTASVAANWRLFCPKSWDDTTITDSAAAELTQARRARCKIPDAVRHREKWRLALDMLDEVLGEPASGGWGLPARPVVGDAGYGEVTEFRLGLVARGLSYVVAVKGTTSAYPVDAAPSAPAYAGRGRPPVPRYRDEPASLATLALAAGRRALHRVTWRHGSRIHPRNPTAAMRSRFLALRVRPANRDIPRNPDGSLEECWLIAEWPPGEPEPTDYWPGLVQSRKTGG